MQFVEAYLAKHNFKPFIAEHPANGLNLCVVIPAYKEPDLLTTLESLWHCTRPSAPAEIIIVINSPENADEYSINLNERSTQDIIGWTEQHPDPGLKIHIINRPNLPKKFAGVGLARKIGMDEAAHRLIIASNPKGIIACFDADATCDRNYLTELEHHFQQYPKSGGVSIYFEHPADNTENPGIIAYELHLRYLNQGLRYAGHPYAFHTVGSSMAVRMDRYVKQGGMNKRQAGEDFYFLQKIIELGHFGEINTTRIIPSARISDRVPFGTGASMKRWEANGELTTYSLNAYEDIRQFIANIDSFRQTEIKVATFSPAMTEYLQRVNFHDELQSIRSNCASLATFRDRFFRWFNAFRVIKFLNFSHETYYQKSSVLKESTELLDKLGLDLPKQSMIDMLCLYRNLDRTGFGLPF